MNKEMVTFGDIRIKNRKINYSKYPINISKVDIDKIIISKKVFFGKNHFKCLEK